MFDGSNTSGICTMFFCLDVIFMNNFRDYIEYFNANYKISPYLNDRSKIECHRYVVMGDKYNQILKRQNLSFTVSNVLCSVLNCAPQPVAHTEHSPSRS
jgi:hypothetical protein